MNLSAVLTQTPLETQTDGQSTVVVVMLVAVALLLVPTSPRFGSSASTPVGRRRANASPVNSLTPGRRGVVGGAAVAGAGVVLVPGLWWVILPAAVIAGVVLARLPTGPTAVQRTADRALVAVHAELLASCLDAGMAVAPALRAVSDVLADPVPKAGPGGGAAGPLGTLDAVAAMLSLGADPGTAWRAADLDENLAPLAAAARRSAAGGGGLAEAVREHAAHLRHETAAASVRAAGRAGVLMTAPLGVCFLPAFLCLGLAPVVVGLLGQLDIF